MSLTTGDVADRANVNYQTVLYYEREGLIDEPPRLDNGYRQYPLKAVQTIQFVQGAKELGFTLNEIQQLLEIRDGSKVDCDKVESFARAKRQDLRKRIEKIQKMESVLSNLIQECDENGGYEDCPILETLVEDKTNGTGN